MNINTCEYDIFYCDNLWIHISASFGMVSIYCKPNQLKNLISQLKDEFTKIKSQPKVDSTNSPDWLTETKSVNVNYNTCSSLEVEREKGYKTRVNWIFNSSGQITIIGMGGKEFIALCDKLISEIDPDLSDDENKDINDGSTFTLDEITTACKNIGYDLTCGACAELFFTGISMHEHNVNCHIGQMDNELFFIG